MKPGDAWGEPTDAAPDLVVTGDDSALAAALIDAPANPLVSFTGRSEIGRSVGIADAGGHAQGLALPMDVLRTPHGVAVNMVILGVAPTRLGRRARRSDVSVTVDGRRLFRGRATTVIVANGQFLGDADVVPRGHPGDGRLEVQVYALAPGERAGMRRRLASGTHVPHPRILATSGRSVAIEATGRPWPVQLDCRMVPPAVALTVELAPTAYRLLI